MECSASEQIKKHSLGYVRGTGRREGIKRKKTLSDHTNSRLFLSWLQGACNNDLSLNKQFGKVLK